MFAIVAGCYAVFWWTLGVWTRFLWPWAAALLVGPLLGLLGRLSGEAIRRGLAAPVTLGALLAGEALLLLGWRDGPPWRPAVLVALVRALAVVARSPRRGVALALLPLAAVAGLGAQHAAATLARALELPANGLLISCVTAGVDGRVETIVGATSSSAASRSSPVSP